jgi:hypothetical protein
MSISNLKPGDRHYMAYVGPPAQYDLIGAAQFRLLCTLGLRAHHCLLDFGCGSLRGGRFFMSYLNEGCYYGIEPNKWLIEDAVNNQIGQDFINLKKPHFNHNKDFASNVFSTQFDFILAQSILSHTGNDLLRKCLYNFRDSLKEEGIVAATFAEGKDEPHVTGWVYPGAVHYHISTIKKLAQDIGLFATRIPWYHPRQTWYIFVKDKKLLPNHAMICHLQGAVLYVPEFEDSWKKTAKYKNKIKSVTQNIKQKMPPALKNLIKKLIPIRKLQK